MIVLSIPYIIVLLLLVAIVCFFKKKYIASGIIILFTLILNIHWRVFPLNVNFAKNPSVETIKVMSFNLNGFSHDKVSRYKDLAKKIIEEDPDVLFLLEDYYDCWAATDTILKELLPYSKGIHPNIGHYFYSKFPLSNMVQLRISSTEYSYTFACTTNIKGSVIQLYGVHLASNNYNSSFKKEGVEDVNGFSKLVDYLGNIESSSNLRCEETTNIAVLSNNTPSIILGDFNDVSGSKPLNILEDAGFKDAWWEGGFGYGATIHHPLPFRIDHIMYNEGLELMDIKKVDSQGLSDHDALVASFRIKK